MPGTESGRIRELLGEMQATQVRRIEELRARLGSELAAWDNGHLAEALHALHAQGRELHFADLRPGFLRRLTGRHRPALERFAAAVDRMSGTARSAREHAQALAARSSAHNDAAREALVQLDAASRELGEQLDQGVGRLQLMCEGINEQRTEGGPQADFAALAEAAQNFTQRFKHLQSISVMVRDIGVRGHAILARRAALLEQVRAEIGLFEGPWRTHVGAAAAAAREGQTPVAGIPKAVEAHDDAMKRLDATLDACGALQGEEQFMSEQLQALGAALPADGRYPAS